MPRAGFIRSVGIAAASVALAIVIVWSVCAVLLDQSLVAVQASRSLLRLGAVDGASLSRGEVWRLITSQFLHVHAPHMLFNALGMLAVGSVLERRGAWVFGLIALVGGSAGQVASVIAYPELVSSGASQSLMALCGAALLLSRTRPALLLVGFILAVQIVLDVRAAQTLKAGHVAGFAAGLLLAGALLLLRPVRTETRTP